ncbi:LacI family DNA-binding transcriptional regulator [Paenibacillus psychroresistens]|uniref:LacI family DNA-binding transcriptional regulator n=1 Tax=Paenibacillus psychroresistens TaxID=1778678 RepID=A0A6B8RJV2_9BACL|nr:substrate-binding domain-containing protein [Paenibacillus psychroresistens]QGQ96107.1 LacI family DNA-binding transcriptional regulator [Paenibacillus psychroresistens]
MNITIRQIADKAGVSRGTVDRVLNGRPGVKPAIRERILLIANELNYVPNVAAKALAHSKKPVLIGIVMPPKEIGFFDDVRLGINDAAAELKGFGIRVEYRYVDINRSEESVEAIRMFIEEKASGIMYCAMDDEEIRESIDYVVEQGVPVITFNSDVENCKRICFVGQDLYKSGRIAAGLMNLILPMNAKVAVITSTLKFHAQRSRLKGFKDGLEKLGKQIEIVEVIEGYERFEDTQVKLQAAFANHPDIQGIYMATGSIEACIDIIKKNSREERIRIVCNDLQPEVEEGIRQGLIDFTIMQNPYQQGYRPLRLLYDFIFMHKQPEQEYYFTETQISISESL